MIGTQKEIEIVNTEKNRLLKIKEVKENEIKELTGEVETLQTELDKFSK